MVKAIIFDIGGVLEIGKNCKITKNHRTLGVHEYISKKFKISPDQWFDSIDAPYVLSIEGKIAKEKVLSVISKNLKTTPKKLERIIVKSYQRHFKHNKKLYKFAFKLKKQGYKIAILSDQWPFSKEALIEKKYAKKFDAIIISCDVGVRKPNPKIYKIILKELKLNAKECVFIDNQTWNIKPAQKLGMKTILFKNNKQAIKDLKKLGVEV